MAITLSITTACDTETKPDSPAESLSTNSNATIESSKPESIVHRARFEERDSFSHSGMKQFLGDEPIEVNFESTYHFSATVSASGPNAEKERQYLGFACYDADGKGIATYHVAKYPGASDTTLARDLNPGDKQIVLTDATGWNNVGSEHRCAIAWYPYTNEQGHTYPKYTYTRHFVPDLWSADAISGNTITLQRAWPGPQLAAGTAVRNAESGGSYNYALNSSLSLPAVPTNLTATVAGVWQKGKYSDTVFRPGTSFIRPLVLANWSQSGSTLNLKDFKIVATP